MKSSHIVGSHFCERNEVNLDIGEDGFDDCVLWRHFPNFSSISSELLSFYFKFMYDKQKMKRVVVAALVEFQFNFEEVKLMIVLVVGLDDGGEAGQ
ncbi:hypothetical protein Leryth_016897 [Lithospermum erythrorhizon]|nr:hypothetical protein Leryth_016897 [Lithospermum erythrorhizon]